MALLVSIVALLSLAVPLPYACASSGIRRAITYGPGTGKAGSEPWEEMVATYGALTPVGKEGAVDRIAGKQKTIPKPGSFSSGWAADG